VLTFNKLIFKDSATHNLIASP